MTHASSSSDDAFDGDRRDELLIDDLLNSLSDDEQREMEKFGLSGDDGLESYGDVVAAFQRLAVDDETAMPAALELAILNDVGSGREAEVFSSSALSEPEAKSTRTLAWVGWLAAASLGVVVAMPLFQQRAESRSPSVLAKSLESSPSTIIVDWSRGDDAAATAASGSVVWNNDEQAGVMRFVGLPVNDPSKSQYQLWIFDAEKDDRYPVDGGVFDIRTDGQSIVPIVAKLNIKDPTLFAITIEQPGGVVVSSRDRLPLLAKVPQS